MRKSDFADAFAMETDEAGFVDAVEHAFDLVVAPLVKDDAGPAGGEESELRGEGPDPFGREIEAGFEKRDRFLRNGAIRFDKVGFSDFGIGLREPIRPVAVVGEKDESRGASIESTCEVE